MSEERKKPNSYTSEFKESAVKLALESDQPIAQTARDLGIAGSRYFCESLFWASQPAQAAKT